jgi:putative Ca2+/H+ antiporter (TMEM165/GDT1 family)
VGLSGLIVAAASAFGIVFVAELGDKTQLVALGFGAKHPLRVVLAGLAIGFGLSGAIATIVGGLLGATLPNRPIAIAGGVLFLGFAAFGVWQAWRGENQDEADEAVATAGKLTSSAVLSIAGGIFLAELGDKTQLATATLAAQANPFATWVGATAGEVTAAMLGALIGRRLGAQLDTRILAYGSALLFAAFGVALLLSAF